MKYWHLLQKPKYNKVCRTLYGNEIRRLAQGMLVWVHIIDTISFISKDDVPGDSKNDVTDGRIVVDHWCRNKSNAPHFWWGPTKLPRRLRYADYWPTHHEAHAQHCDFHRKSKIHDIIYQYFVPKHSFDAFRISPAQNRRNSRRYHWTVQALIYSDAIVFFVRWMMEMRVWTAASRHPISTGAQATTSTT